MPSMAETRTKSLGVTFRMSPQDRERLRAEARQSGLESVQQLLELRLFGEVRPRDKTGPKPRPVQDERLEISA